jgi:hypothetical protein
MYIHYQTTAFSLGLSMQMVTSILCHKNTHHIPIYPSIGDLHLAQLHSQPAGACSLAFLAHSPTAAL